MATRKQILESAAALLQEKGYAGLSIAALCSRADVSPTSLYWHFGSKAGLMEAVIERIGGGHVARIQAAIARADSPEERLDALIGGIRELVTTQPLGSLTGVAVVGEGRHVTSELRDALRRAREKEAEAIAEGFARALGSDDAAATLAIVTLSCTNYAALIYRMSGEAADVDRILDGLRDALQRLAAAAR